MVEAGYLLSRFPSIVWSTDWYRSAAYTLQDFEQDCYGILPAHKALDTVTAVRDPFQSDFHLAQEWSDLLYSLRHEVARLRWSELRSSHFPQKRGIPVFVEAQKLALQIPLAENPHEAQFMFYRTQWEYLELLDSHYFRVIENVLVFGWKLKLMARVVEYEKTLGENHWNYLVDTLTEKAGFTTSAIRGGVV